MNETPNEVASISSGPAQEDGYYSCRWLEGGLCFSIGALRACAEIHHGRGEPKLMDYAGGPLDFNAIREAKDEIYRQNQQGGHPACKGCPNLVFRPWPVRTGKFDWIGITHDARCNLECNYCWLQWADYAPRHNPASYRKMRYSVLGPLRELLARDLLENGTLIDWGGGGEPTLFDEFEELLTQFSRRKYTQWLHTNGVRAPAAMLDETTDCSNIHILCSVDAGGRETYQKMKKRDEYRTVWRNLFLYRQRGAHVVVKYIVTDENCSRKEISSFVQDVVRHGRPLVLADIDHRYPDVNSEILAGLAFMKLTAWSSGLDFAFGETGSDSYPEKQIPLLVEKSFGAQWPAFFAKWSYRVRHRRLIGSLFRILARGSVRIYEIFC
jgi:pyruvate-formate lyase-activating enzyme